jgi:hypothetical protein
MNVPDEVQPEDRPSWRRWRKLIKPRLQLRLIASFALVSGIGFLLQALLTLQLLAEQSARGPGLTVESVAGLVWSCLSYSFLCFLPLVVVVGGLATFRLAGPIHRFEQHLAAVARGEDPGPCQIRRGDELHELCERINESVAALRSAHPAPRPSTPPRAMAQSGGAARS